MRFNDINEGEKAKTHGDVAIKLLKCSKENDCTKCDGLSDCFHYTMRALSVVFDFIDQIDDSRVEAEDEKKDKDAIYT